MTRIFYPCYLINNITEFVKTNNLIISILSYSFERPLLKRYPWKQKVQLWTHYNKQLWLFELLLMRVQRYRMNHR